VLAFAGEIRADTLSATLNDAVKAASGLVSDAPVSTVVVVVVAVVVAMAAMVGGVLLPFLFLFDVDGCCAVQGVAFLDLPSCQSGLTLDPAATHETATIQSVYTSGTAAEAEIKALADFVNASKRLVIIAGVRAAVPVL